MVAVTLDIREYDANELRNGLEYVDTHASVLVSSLQDPIVTSNEVAVWHDVLRRRFPQDYSSDVGPLVGVYIIKPVINFFESQKVEVSSVYVAEVCLPKLLLFLVRGLALLFLCIFFLLLLQMRWFLLV